jgi:MoaA/NifB/PqqE/SkfB family radical SAM enzyme
MYTNGTLIDEDMARRFAECGNITPAISVEGLRETTEKRRGRGVFERILRAMEVLRAYNVPFGISVTATSENVEEIVSEEFIDFYFNRYEAAYGWLFHYMPIGRDIDHLLIPTPKQRIYLWERTWEIVKERKIMYVDFWNHGTVSGGCISGGRDGGYLYCDWNGDIYPCVFFPYSTANIYRIYEKGGNLNNVINLPLHSKIRNWQSEYRGRGGDLLRPCPIRDHYIMAKSWLCSTKEVTADRSSLEILQDEAYEEKMSLYDKMLEEETSPIWKEKYLNEGSNFRNCQL